MRMATTSSFVADGTTLRRKDRDEKRAEPSNGNHKYLSDSRDSRGRTPSERTFRVRSDCGYSTELSSHRGN